MSQATPEQKTLLARIVEAVRSAHGERVRGVVLYGSEARGAGGAGSDIDVLVLLDGPIRYADDLLANLEALYSLSSELDRRISAKPVDADEYESADSPLLRSARTDGLTA